MLPVRAPSWRWTRPGGAQEGHGEQALGRFLGGEADGYDADPSQTVAACLNARPDAKALVLKPTTMARYRDYVRNDRVPGFGAHPRAEDPLEPRPGRPSEGAGVPRITVHDLRHLAAREAVDTTDHTLTKAEKARHETGHKAWLRPPWLRTHERPSSHS